MSADYQQNGTATTSPSRGLILALTLTLTLALNLTLTLALTLTVPGPFRSGSDHGAHGRADPARGVQRHWGVVPRNAQPAGRPHAGEGAGAGPGLAARRHPR